MGKSNGKQVAGALIGATVIPLLIFIVLGAILQLDIVFDYWRMILTVGVISGGFIGWKWIL